MEHDRETVEKLFSQYKANLDKCAFWEEEIFAASDKDELISTLKQRSMVLRNVFAENNDIIANMLSRSTHLPTKLPLLFQTVFKAWVLTGMTTPRFYTPF